MAMFLRPKGCLNEPNITKLYSLRNVPVDLLHQVGSCTHRGVRPRRHTHWCCGVTNDKRRGTVVQSNPRVGFAIPGNQLWRWGTLTCNVRKMRTKRDENAERNATKA